MFIYYFLWVVSTSILQKYESVGSLIPSLKRIMSKSTTHSCWVFIWSFVHLKTFGHYIDLDLDPTAYPEDGGAPRPSSGLESTVQRTKPDGPGIPNPWDWKISGISA